MAVSREGPLCDSVFELRPNGGKEKNHQVKRPREREQQVNTESPGVEKELIGFKKGANVVQAQDLRGSEVPGKLMERCWEQIL